MNAYIFQAALLCEPCALNVRELRADYADNQDSDSYPQGPYADGSGEADSPNHCDACGLFLENSLTCDGADYVREAVAKHDKTGHGMVANEWRAFYSYLFDSSEVV